MEFLRKRTQIAQLSSSPLRRSRSFSLRIRRLRIHFTPARPSTTTMRSTPRRSRLDFGNSALPMFTSNFRTEALCKVLQYLYDSGRFAHIHSGRAGTRRSSDSLRKWRFTIPQLKVKCKWNESILAEKSASESERRLAIAMHNFSQKCNLLNNQLCVFVVECGAGS